MKLVDVPEMNYYAADNAGEVCGYGENVFRGYLHDEGKTKEAVDSDGWLHTGDIGMWTEVSFLHQLNCHPFVILSQPRQRMNTKCIEWFKREFVDMRYFLKIDILVFNSFNAAAACLHKVTVLIQKNKASGYSS